MKEIQSSYTIHEKNINIYFWVFIGFHLLIWTIGPLLVRPSLTHDTLEGITWGLQWQFGYNKHPFLTAWLCAGMTRLLGTVGWPVYLLAQLVVTLTFWAVWKLARQILPVTHALIASLLLEGVLFYNLNSFNLTPDTLQSPLWALFALFSYQALTQKKNSNWFLAALFASLGVVTKYQTILLILSLLVFCIINPTCRQQFKKPQIYGAMLVFILLISPHIVWLVQHDWITLTYAAQTSANDPLSNSIMNHLMYPLRFLLSSLSNVFGVFILLWPFYRSSSSEDIHLRKFDWQFLCCLGLGPLLVTMIMAIISGDEFPSRWSTPYYFLIGILMMSYLKPILTRERLRLFALTLLLFSLSVFTLRMGSFLIHPRLQCDQFLPNQDIAQGISKIWSERYDTPVPYIAGSHYLVALTLPYISGAPKPYFDWSNEESPWINENELRKKGAVFIWDEGRNFIWDPESMTHALLSKNILHRFPLLMDRKVYTFFRLSKGKEPIKIGMAILPPENERSF